MEKLKKIIIPVAGLGTRMLPATKAIPKEMLPIAGKPIIQHVVEEIRDAGFEEIVLVTHSSKSSIEDHFDTSFELEATLDKRIKRALLKEIKNISKLGVSIESIRQGNAKGLGHAVLVAKKIIGKEPFAVLLPDMLLQDSDPTNNLALMKNNFDINNISSILFSIAPKKDISKYGIGKIKKVKNLEVLGKVESIIEKPSLKKAPSNYYAVGRYIFSSDLMIYLEKVRPDKNNEIQLSDAIDMYIKNQSQVLAFKAEGKVHDCGNRLGYSIANLEYTKTDPEIGDAFKKYLKRTV